MLCLVILVPSPHRASRFITHEPIEIIGKPNWVPGGGILGGEGTLHNPYLIEGWEIDASLLDRGEAALGIYDTDDHYVIRDVFIHSGGTDSYGLWLETVTHTRIESIIISDTRAGLYLRIAANVTIEGTTISGSDSYGIRVIHSRDVTIMANSVSNHSVGIQVENTTGAIIDGNTVADNANGIKLHHSANAILTGNVLDKNRHSVLLDTTTNASVHHNNLITSSANQAFDNQRSDNSWDDGYPTGGNYWSDFEGVDECSGAEQDICPGPDGIGDTPYTIQDTVFDRYPLMQPLPLDDGGGRASTADFPALDAFRLLGILVLAVAATLVVYGFHRRRKPPKSKGTPEEGTSPVGPSSPKR